MAEQDEQTFYPSASTMNGFHKSDRESLRSGGMDGHPRLRPRGDESQGPQVSSRGVQNQASPSFDMTFVAPIRIKNTNFGLYKYDATLVDFTYWGVVLGQVNIFKSKINFKSTKKIEVEVLLSSSALLGANSSLANELKNGVITLGSQGIMNGKVTPMLMFKKKSTEMNCTMAIDVASKVVQSVECL